ncbi:hypothetical protein JCM11251_002158 [Rhodosporidiobolus azoricus]
MDSNPWGAADDDSFASSLPRPPSPKLDLTPATSTTSFTAPSWSTDEGGGWGAGVDDYVPPAIGVFDTASGAGEASDIAVEEAAGNLPTSTLDSSSGGGWGAESPEMPKLSIATESPSATTSGFAPSPPLPPVAFAAPSSRPASPPSTSISPSSPSSAPITAEAAAEEDDGQGWGGAPVDDLPPIASLRIARPPSPSSPSTDRASGWVHAAESGWEPPEIPVPLPSFGDAFENQKVGRRRGSEGVGAGEEGEEAWGSAKGWEERKRIEEEQERERLEEEERLRRVAEEEREAAITQPPATNPSPAPTSSLSRFSNIFKKGVTDTATKSAETLKNVHSNLTAPPPPATGMSSIQGDPAPASAGDAQGHAGDEFDVDAPGGARTQAQAKSSWWGKKPAAQLAQPVEEEDPRSLGVEEVQQGESGRVASPEPQQGAVGRFLSRFKKTNAQAEGEQQQKQEDQVQGRSSSETAAFDAAGFDALASGGLGKVTLPSQQLQRQRQLEEEDEVDHAYGGFFGDRLGSSSSRRGPQQLAQAPPEDDFGGLLGAFSAPPSRPIARPAQSKALDPFDPLSENFGAGPTAVKKPMVLNRPSKPPPPVSTSSAAAVASFHSLAPPPPSQPVRNSSPTGDESFDAFFDSVVASTAKPVAPAIRASSVSPPPVLSPLPRTRPPSSAPSLHAPSHRPSTVAPPPRIATISPPARTLSASPASSSGRATTPILPLAPPPPPSQPLAASRGAGGAGLISIDAPPPPASTVLVQRTSTPLSAAALAPSPVGGIKPVLASSQQKVHLSEQQQKKASGPLSLDDLSFFES